MKFDHDILHAKATPQGLILQRKTIFWNSRFAIYLMTEI